MQSRGVLRRTDDGRCCLVFERHVRHPPLTVWRALTEVEHLRRWFADVLDYDRASLDLGTTGAELAFVPLAGSGIGETEPGTVLRAHAPVLLEYTWGQEILRWELRSDDSGGCLLTFTNVFGDPDFAPFNALGWHIGLDRLGALLDGDDPRRTPLDVDEAAAETVRQDYERAFA